MELLQGKSQGQFQSKGCRHGLQVLIAGAGNPCSNGQEKEAREPEHFCQPSFTSSKIRHIT